MNMPLEMLMKFLFKMKAFIILFLATLLACGQTQDKTINIVQADKTLKATTTNPKDALNEYQRFFLKLDTLSVETVTTAAKKYQEVFSSEDVETRDEGYIIFNSYYLRLTESINVAHAKDTTNFEPLIFLDASGKSLPISLKLKAYSDRLTRNGFQISSTEGMSYIKQDREYIEKWFYKHVSTTMKSYLQQLNKENKEGFQEDAGLTIEPKQFVDRLNWWDNFILNNLNFALVNAAVEHRKQLLTTFLVGMDNSPIIDYDTNKLSEYFKIAYTYLQNNYPNSETNKATKPYFKALLKGQNANANALISRYKTGGIILDF
jgi:hypothetical protein